MPIVRNKESVYVNDRLNEDILQGIFLEHTKTIDRFTLLDDYYNGNQVILKRERNEDTKVNNKLMINHAEYITDFATAYFMGNPIKYRFANEDKITDDDKILKAFKIANIDQVDTELSRDVSKFGVGYELIYQNSKGQTRSINIDPRNIILVVDDTVEESKLLGIHFYKKYDDEGNPNGHIFNIYTYDGYFYKYHYKDNEFTLLDESEHLFSSVPVIEYWNKSNQKGDYESVLSLIDAYNLLQSDRINDKQQFVDALLVIYGILAGDTSEEKLETARELRKLGMLEMPLNSKAEFITKTFNEADIEVLKNSIINDIHKISKVPNLTDENFAGNSSGVAMKYKLLGLEQLAQTKEGYYRIGIKERLSLYADILNIKQINVDIDDVEISFTRSLPVNEVEISTLINNLSNVVSTETLISLLPFVEDVKNEMTRLEEQKTNNISFMQNTFGGYKIPDEESELLNGDEGK